VACGVINGHEQRGTEHTDCPLITRGACGGVISGHQQRGTEHTDCPLITPRAGLV